MKQKLLKVALCYTYLGHMPMEVEILETLHERRKNPGWLLARWQRSGLRHVAFNNFIVTKVDPNLSRPSRMTERVEAAFVAAAERLTGRELTNSHEPEQTDINQHNNTTNSP